MQISAADLAGLARKREQPTRAPGELLAVFVRGKLVNTKNRRLFWKAEMAYKQGWRERVAQVLLLEAGWDRRSPAVTARAPKRVAFLASVQNLMDSHDGLRVALAPVVDGLKDCSVIAGDADRDGNVFEYRQQIDRTRRGVEIRVSPL